MKKGQALVEMMVGMGITAAIMPALITSFFAARGGSAQEQVRMQAQGRLREAREVLRMVKSASWTNVSTDGTYHLTLSNGTWGIAQNPPAETGLDGLFSRQIIIAPAYRTVTGGLTSISSGNTLDPSVKHITITVSWTTPIASSVISDYYLMRLENLAYIETLFSDFSSASAVHRSTVATNVSGGEVQLGSGGSGIGDWCSPSLVLQPLNITHQSVPQSLSAVPGHAYMTNGDNSSGSTLTSIDITNPTPPTLPLATESSDYSLTPKEWAYGLFADTNYIYVATKPVGNPKKTVDIISASTLTSAGYFVAAGNPTGDSVYVSGTVGYATSGTTLYSFNLAGTLTPAPLIASTTIAGSSKRIKVVGNYVYVVTSSTTKQLQIFDKTTLAQVGTGLNLGNNQGGVDIYVTSAGTYAYIVTSYASPDFFVVDLSSKSSPTVVGTYTTGSNMNPLSLTVIEVDSRAIIVGSGSDLYQVLKINVPSSPTRCSSSLTFPSVTSIYAISSVTEADGDAYSYLLTNDANAEFQMIQGGPGGGSGGTAKTGVFDSQPFAPATSATFNYFTVNTTLPSGTYDNYQVAITNKVNGSCAAASYTFVGPGKDPSQWFSSSSTIPLGSATGYNNPGECFRYRVSLSTDNLGTTPVFNDITVNYSP